MHGATEYISNINYNEMGQRTELFYGNGTQTTHTYKPKSFRLTNIYTRRNGASDALQDLNFTFDAVGNIVQQNDNAQQLHYYSNQVIAPNATYTYDPLYRLINAKGRELTSLTAPTPNDFTNSIGAPNTAANAMQTYNHTYVFDELGNMQSDNWKDYVYDTETNRLLKHDPNQTLNDYTYDVHGNMLTMPHLTSMVWDFADRLQSAGNGTFTSYYNYDMGGNRSRKVVIKNNNREERYYIGDYEIYRKYINDELDTERSTVHIIDDRDRFAMIETETGNNPVVRYQYNNHLGSACLELDTTAQIISYEEYHPYGTTSYRSGRTETEVSLKRYKYVGKERDEETGLYYYGARYYAAWLCRFVSVDALQFKYPIYTPYQYAGNRPIIAIDIDGLEPFMPDSAMAPKKQPDNYVCSDNSDIQIPYREDSPENSIIDIPAESNIVSNESSEYKMIPKVESYNFMIDKKTGRITSIEGGDKYYQRTDGTILTVAEGVKYSGNEDIAKLKLVDKLINNEGKSFFLKHGMLSIKQRSEKYDIYNFDNAVDTDDFYHFVAASSDVEWARGLYNNSGGIVGTDHSEINTSMEGRFLENDAGMNMLINLSHSHPGGIGEPSFDLRDKKNNLVGDCNSIANKETSIKYEVYFPSGNEIYEYDRYSLDDARAKKQYYTKYKLQ